MPLYGQLLLILGSTMLDALTDSCGVGAGSKNDPVTALCLSRKLLPDLVVAGLERFFFLALFVSPLVAQCFSHFSAFWLASAISPIFTSSSGPSDPVTGGARSRLPAAHRYPSIIINIDDLSFNSFQSNVFVLWVAIIELFVFTDVMRNNFESDSTCRCPPRSPPMITACAACGCCSNTPS